MRELTVRSSGRARCHADDGSVQDLAPAAAYLGGMLSHSSTGVPVVDAQEDFLRARRAHLAARLVRSARVKLGRRFDERFRPTCERARACWERVALTVRRGIALAPITVVNATSTRG
jgi:hypothetical protein